MLDDYSIKSKIIPDIKAKKLENELPILIYSYYSGYPPRKTVQDIISTIRGPKEQTKSYDWLINEELNVLDLRANGSGSGTHIRIIID